MDKKKIILSGLLSILLLSGCKGSDNGGPVNSSYNLTADSFDVSSMRNLESYEITQILNNNADFMYEDRDSGAIDSCFEGKIGNYAFVRNPDNTYRLSIPDTDLTDCYSNPYDRIYNSCVYSLFLDKVMAKDTSGNLVDLEGKKFSDMWNFITPQFLYRSMITINATFTTGSGMRYVGNYLSALHASTGLNEPCVEEGVNNCRIQDVLIVRYIDNPSYDYNDKSLLDTHSLEVVAGAPYYVNGTIAFTINDWSGTMTYGSDAYSAPTYTASNGSENVSGTYTPVLSPALKPGMLGGEVKRSIKEMIHRTLSRK